MTERPVVFGRSRSLFGITCMPAIELQRPDVPSLVFLNAGIIHRVGPNRLYVQLARALAGNGIGSLRFDLGGIGDSSVAPGEAGTVQDFVQRDIKDALDYVCKDAGDSGVVLVGLCSGADNALLEAMRNSRVVGAVLIDPYTHITKSFYFNHYRKRIFSFRTWSLLLTVRHPVYRRLWLRMRNIVGSPEPPEETDFSELIEIPSRKETETQLQLVTDRGCRLLFIFSGGLEERYNHQNQFFRAYPSLRGHPNIQLEYIPDADHTFTLRQHQKKVMSMIVSWIDNNFLCPSGKRA